MVIHTALADPVIGAAIQVHRVLGPGLMESTYAQCFAKELQTRKIRFERETPVPVEYDGLRLKCGYRIDFLIEGQLVVELKAVERVLPVHQAQSLTYMKLLSARQGLLINFNVTRLVHGLRSFLR